MGGQWGAFLPTKDHQWAAWWEGKASVGGSWSFMCLSDPGLELRADAWPEFQLWGVTVAG